MRQLINGLSPRPSATTLTAANALKYRDFLTVVLILKDEEGFADNWIYIHDPGVRVGRIQNFRSWSPEMVPVPGTVCYGLEYFCFEGDGLWNSTDEELLQLGASELANIGLGHTKDVLDGCVVRQRKAYPVYDDGYASNVETIRRELRSAYPNLHLVGRNGMHKYNNQDHAMMTAMLCVRNIVAGRQVYDLWQVNQDAEYHEGGTAGEVKSFGLRTVPARAR
jgi:protoporphyrinogen oxidase